MLALQSRAVDLCTKAVHADKTGEDRRALHLYKQALEALLAWLSAEPKPEARAALKLRVRGYIARAEELKAVLEPAAAGPMSPSSCDEEAETDTSAASPSPAPSEVGGKAETKEEPGGGSHDEANDKDVASTTTAAAADDATEDTSTAALVLELPLLPPAARPAAADEEEEGSDGCRSQALDARAAWLKGWETALAAKDAELRRREREIEARERALAGEEGLCSSSHSSCEEGKSEAADDGGGATAQVDGSEVVGPSAAGEEKDEAGQGCGIDKDFIETQAQE